MIPKTSLGTTGNTSHGIINRSMLAFGTSLFGYLRQKLHIYYQPII